MAEPTRRYTQDGRARYRHRDDGTEFSVAWSAGYPPVQLGDHLAGRPLDDFEREGDDPLAHLEDVPPAEA